METHASLASLPTELYATILDQINPAELQESTLALRLAIPRSPVPLHQLFKHIRITSRSQVPRLWQRLDSSRKADSERAVANWVHSFHLDTFDVDADVLYNALRLIPQIRYLHLNIGTTFAPEHLDDIFRKPKDYLKCLSLRFRPYVEKATYYQFLKGQYSDILVEHLTNWTSNPELTHLSMIQDPLPASSFDPHTSFAQPIVFFSLEVFRPFSRSPLAHHITHLRIRVPSRLVLAQLLEPGAFPALRALDIGTSALGNPERAIPLLLARHSKLEHLLLDDCSLSREGWRDLARACALAGQGKSRIREKKVNEWLEAMSARQAVTTSNEAEPNANAAGNNNPLQRRAPRHGRRGVAAPTFSIRAAPAASQATPIAIAGPSNSEHVNGLDAPSRKSKIRILPPLPTLLTLSTTLTPPPDANKAEDWRTEFESGWRSGIDVLLSVRARLHTTATISTSHVRIMRFSDLDTASDLYVGADLEDGLRGLIDVSSDDLEVWEARCINPLVCFGEIRPAQLATALRHHTDIVDVDEDEHNHVYNHAAAFSDIVHSESQVDHHTTSSQSKYTTREDGHVHECGHELHNETWNIYDRYTASQ